jgi:hypothetical protein
VGLHIGGTGFKHGATVSLDGQATEVTVMSPALITATAPLHAGGTVDLVVTNPDGERRRLAATPICRSRPRASSQTMGSRAAGR